MGDQRILLEAYGGDNDEEPESSSTDRLYVPGLQFDETSDRFTPLKAMVVCGKCNHPMHWPNAHKNEAKCPNCRHHVYLSRNSILCRGIMCVVAGLLLILATIGVTAGTFAWSSRHGGIFIVWTGLFISGIVLLVRAIVYFCFPCCMTQGHIEYF